MSRRRKRDKPAASNPPTSTVQEKAVPSRPPLSRRRKWLFRLTVDGSCARAVSHRCWKSGCDWGATGIRRRFSSVPTPTESTRPTLSLDGDSFRAPSRGNRMPCFISAKASGAVRIFVLGSSAAQGVPNPSFSFGRILEVMLRERYPDVKFEVINAAMTAINSHVALEIARDCAAHQPDLFVVYMGNNEVVGPYGPGTVFQQWSPSRKLIQANVWLKSTARRAVAGRRDGRLHFRNGTTPAAWRGMEMFMGNQVAADDPRLAAVYDNFRQNLMDICGIARRAGAAVILSTVAVNLRDCPPFASQHRSDLSAEELAEWESLYQAGVELESKSRWEEALKKYEAAARIDDRFAELPFRLGRCLAVAWPAGGGPRSVCLRPRPGRVAISRRFSDQRDHPRGGGRGRGVGRSWGGCGTGVGQQRSGVGRHRGRGFVLRARSPHV